MTPHPQHLPTRTGRPASTSVTPASAPPTPPAPRARPEEAAAAGPAKSGGVQTRAQLTAIDQAVAQSSAPRAWLDVAAAGGDDVQVAVVGQGGS